MSEVSGVVNAKMWQRNRALELEREFIALAAAMQNDGTKLMRGIERVAKALNGRLITAGVKGDRRVMKKLRCSTKTLYKEWQRWKAGGCVPEALLLDYKYRPPRDGSMRAVPVALIAEIQRRCTLSLGGRNKEGLTPISDVFNWLRRDFEDRQPLPGINYDEFPDGAEFPFSYRTVVRHAPPDAERALGNRGFAAFKARAAYVPMDYSQLRKCELFTLDDVRLDFLCIDDFTGRAIEVRCYIFMEVASRFIVAFILKPKDAIRQEDVDELTAHALQVPGFGIGRDYITHILFENGAVACSAAAQQALEGVTHGRIQIHRNKMISGVRWIGAARDVASGNAAGKGVIESFHRRLHSSLIHVPGQIGNKWEHAPANVGYGTTGKNGAAPRTLIAEAEKLSKFEVAFRKNGNGRLRLQLPMMRLSQVTSTVRDAIKRHNHEPGHDYADHGKFAQEEIERGVWRDAE